MNVKKFKDRIQAGKLLATRLEAYANRPDMIVLALPRGGVPVGFAVAQKLNAPLDILLVRKLGVPGHEELAMGAIASGGEPIVQANVVQMFSIPDEVIKEVTRRERIELQRRDALYRFGRPPPPLKDREVILIDDGLATGATMIAAARAVRSQHPAHLTIAVPVGAPDICNALHAEADQVDCLRTPEPFRAVSLWYEEFPQTSDDEVIDLLARSQQFPPGGAYSGNTPLSKR